MTTKPPITAASLPEGWPETVREVVRREGRAVRGLGASATIEIKSLTDNSWSALLLPGGGITFQTFEDRNEVLRRVLAP